METPQGDQPVFDYPEDTELPYMVDTHPAPPVPHYVPPAAYVGGGGAAPSLLPPRRKHHRVLWYTALALALGAVAVAGLWGLVRPHGETTVAHTPDYAACQPDSTGKALRAEYVMTRESYLSDEVRSADEGAPQWCVFTTSYDSGMRWGLAYVGEDNPLYAAMVAYRDSAGGGSNALIVYQGMPPLKFAQDGWIGFVEEDTSEFHATSSAIMVLQAAADALSKQQEARGK